MSTFADGEFRSKKFTIPSGIGISIGSPLDVVGSPDENCTGIIFNDSKVLNIGGLTSDKRGNNLRTCEMRDEDKL